MFSDLSEITAKILRRKGFDSIVESSHVFSLIEKYYKLVLPQINIKPYKIVRKTVYIKVLSSVIANECYNHIEGCLESINIASCDIVGLKFNIGRFEEEF